MKTEPILVNKHKLPSEKATVGIQHARNQPHAHTTCVQQACYNRTSWHRPCHKCTAPCEGCVQSFVPCCKNITWLAM